MCVVVAVGVRVCGAVGVGAKGNGRESVMMTQNVIFDNPKLEVEHVKELSLDAADVTFSEDPCAERPVDVLECGVVEVLQRRKSCQYHILQNKGEERLSTLLASITAPRKTRSQAHSSRAMCKCGFARST